jgi:tRNA (guanine-N1)-methyltransferase
MRFDVLTLFPDLFQGYFTQSLLKLALQRGIVEIHLWNVRDWAKGKHKSVDDRPFGGGPGMVIMPEPVFDAVESVQTQAQPGLLVMLTPGGQRLTQEVVRELATHTRILLLCGRYEGFDERIRIGLRPREISIGDFVCNGGEVPASPRNRTASRDDWSIRNTPGRACSAPWKCLKYFYLAITRRSLGGAKYNRNREANQRIRFRSTVK